MMPTGRPAVRRCMKGAWSRLLRKTGISRAAATSRWKRAMNPQAPVTALTAPVPQLERGLDERRRQFGIPLVQQAVDGCALDFLITDRKRKSGGVTHISGHTGVGRIQDQDSDGFAVPGLCFSVYSVDSHGGFPQRPDRGIQVVSGRPSSDI